MSTNPSSQRRKTHTSQRASQISPSGIRRFFDLLASIDGVISLGVGEPDFTTPWHIREAAIQSLEQGYTMYTSNMGIPELRQGENVLLVPPRDPEALCEAARQAEQDPALRQRIGGGAQTLASYFTWERIAERTVDEVFEPLLSGPGSRAP